MDAAAQLEGTPTTGKRVPYFDGFRGVAVLLVVFQHVQPKQEIPTWMLGVDIFSRSAAS